jgi:hypothetical protein
VVPATQASFRMGENSMRLPSLLAAVGLATAGLVATAPAATAAGSCSIYAPSKLAIGAPFRTITIEEGPNCTAAGVTDAAWTAVHPTKGPIDIIIYENGSRSETFDIYGEDPIGKWTWRPEGAFDAIDNEVYQYTTYTDVRLASYGRVYPTRSGSKVNIKTLAGRYWQSGAKFIGWSSARGQIQYRTPGTTTWHSLKEVYSTSTGTYSYTYSTTAVRDYRVVYYNVSTIWGSTSPIVRK